MFVSVQLKGNRIAGINIGSANVQQYFSHRNAVIELHLGHLVIQCPLSQRFWEDRPEIDDPRLCGWLESKRLHVNGDVSQVFLQLSPMGSVAFHLSSVPVLVPAEQRVPERQPIPGVDPLLQLPLSITKTRSRRSHASAAAVHGLTHQLAG
ncbi:MAG: hypothetical protein P4L03_01700 [Terracidiphilus sp.]|nr:hypothetical protein [Terracidiphilus sp.]